MIHLFVRVAAIFLLLKSPPSFSESLHKGLSDFSEVEWNENSWFEITGEWSFYWDQLLSPEDLRSGQGSLSAYLPIQAEWHKVKHLNLPVRREGSATYHMQLKIPPDTDVELEIPEIRTASKVWIDDRLIQDFGKVSLDPSEAKGRVERSHSIFSSKTGTVRITVQVSNYLFWYGGLSTPFRIGNPKAMNDARFKAAIRDALVLGLILFMACYHIYIWLLLKRGNETLFLGLFCLSIAIRSAVMGEGQILQSLWSSMPLGARFFLEYFGLASSVGFMLSFIRCVFPDETMRGIYYPIIGCSGIWSLFIFFTAPNVYPFFLETFQYVIIFAGLLAIATLILASLRNRDGSRTYLFGTMVFFATVANDLSLSNRVANTVPLVQFGLVFLILTQSFLLARRFAHAFIKVEKAEHFEKMLNANLEQRIRERTDQINTILNHVQSGFLLVDRTGRIQNGFTSSCSGILGRDLQAEQLFQGLFSAVPRLGKQFSLALSQIFEDHLPQEVTLGQIPNRFPCNHRIVGLRAAVVRDSMSRISSVLLTIDDLSALVAAEEELRKTSLIIRILEDQDAFRIFLSDVQQSTIQIKKSILNGNFQQSKAFLHTLKGNAASIGFQELANIIHLIEDNPTPSVPEVQEIEDFLRTFLATNQGLSELNFDSLETEIFRIDQSEIQSLSDAIKSETSTQGMAVLSQWKQDITGVHIRSYTTYLVAMAQHVSGQLQKRAIVNVIGSELKVDRVYRGFLGTLTHLVRNALDHGLEQPSNRHNKPECGTIELKFVRLEDRSLQIEVSDDGRGLDCEAILTKARQLGLQIDFDPKEKSRVFELIFHPGFSTAAQVTELSGRGVGLWSVALAVKELGGHYEIQSEPGWGTRFKIVLPAPIDIRSVLSSAV